ncbi:MAG: hypothetical protein ABI697_06800 [Devosia sp.]
MADSADTIASSTSPAPIALTHTGEAYVALHAAIAVSAKPANLPDFKRANLHLSHEAVERRIERHLAVVTALIAILDAAAEDVDLEDDGITDDLSAPEGWRSVAEIFRSSEDAEDDGISEPSLGAPETSVRLSEFDPSRTAEGAQTHWAKGRGDDDEAVNEDGYSSSSGAHDDDGPAWAEAIDQTVLEIDSPVSPVRS